MKRELVNLLIQGGLLIFVVLFTVLVISHYNGPEATEKRRRSAPSASPQALEQMQTYAMRLFEEKRYAEAERTTKRILTFDRSNPAALRLLGNIYYTGGRYYEAGNTFRVILARDPDDAAVRYNLGLSLIGMQWFEAGIRELQTARSANPLLPGIDLHLSLAYQELGDGNKAAYYHNLAEEAAKQSNRVNPPQADTPTELPEPNHE